MRLLSCVLAALLSSSCGWVSFERRKSVEAAALESSVRAYYEEVVLAFAAGDAERLTVLFSPSITKPMTRPQILDWGRRFFGEHGPARFKVERLSIEELGPRRAVAYLTYSVRTASGKGGFGGTERDVLERADGGRWVMMEWEKR